VHPFGDGDPETAHPPRQRRSVFCLNQDVNGPALDRELHHPAGPAQHAPDDAQ
jgi:hypothetical protein